MLEQCDRAFKEWAIVCEALKSGRQTVLLRKGGIREEDGVFRVSDTEFFLLPTYEHQDPSLLQPAFVEELQRSGHDAGDGLDPSRIRIDAYCTIELTAVAKDEAQAARLADEHIWNEAYVRMRFDFNPYDPLYVLMLRAYRLPEAVTLPLRNAYEGCKSWVTLERPLSTIGAVPAIPDEEFAERRAAVAAVLHAGS